MSKDVAIKPRAVPFGSYHLLERLAVGGMAEVYLAKSFGLAGVERLVALKRILPSIAEDDEFIAMFIDEAKIAGQLNHANIAQIFDLGKINASYFIAMEYVSGHDLRALWERTRDRGDGMPIALACNITQKICEGLDYAHRRRDNRGRPLNIIHRDVSPQNVLLSYDGDVKVIDFGIAKAANRMVRTQTGILKGKFAYMAPEQARGEPTDHRADIFAIGVILYELLTGERAFKADSDFQLLEKVRKVEIKEPRKVKASIPRELERIVYKAMERDAGDRYAHASVLAGELERFLQNQGLTANREETGAYLRSTFKEEHEEERRRLEIYHGFKLEDAKPRVERTPVRAPEAPAKPARVTPEQVTRVKIDPSREGRNPDEEIHYLGTEVGDAVGFDESEHGDIAEPTRLLSDEQGSRPAETPSHRPASRVRALDDDPSAIGDHGAKGAATVVITAGAEETRVFSAEDDSVGDATMIDDNPVLASPIPVPQKDSTRPDVRSSALGQVMSDGVSDASHHHDENLFGAKPARRRDRGLDISSPTTDAIRVTSRSEVDAAPERLPTHVATSPAMNLSRDRAIAFGVGLTCGLVVAGIVALVGGDPDAVIITTPANSKVTLKEEVICERTPCALSISSGKHELVFVADGHDPLSRTVDVTGDGITVVQVDLPRRMSGLVLETTPPGAKITLNGKVLSGETPVKLPELVVGDKVELLIAAKGFEPLQDIFEVPDTGKGPWHFDLVAAETAWTISPEPADAIVVDESGKGHEGKTVLKVKRGVSEAYRVLRPGCDGYTGAISGTGSLDDGQDVKLACKPFEARLTVSVRGKAEYVIDGVELPGRRSLFKYELPVGAHDVLVKPRRGREERFPIELKRGEEIDVPLRLR